MALFSISGSYHEVDTSKDKISARLLTEVTAEGGSPIKKAGKYWFCP
jgi:hypothetical protein